MNFSAIPAKSLLGRTLRLTLKLIPPRTRMPILQGKLQGKKWIVGSGVHGYWLGSYESEKQRAFAELVAAGDIVFDIGANAGFFTLLASECVGFDGHVYAFEPVPRNLFYLREHLRLNRIGNVTVVEAAVSDQSGWAFFNEGPNSAMGHLAPDGSLQVKRLCLDEVVPGQIAAPDCVKIDVEGAELQVLSGARTLLAEVHPSVFLATHGDESHKQCCRALESQGYRVQSLDGRPLGGSREVLALYKG
jgi:FkbM family methyltransferase